MVRRRQAGRWRFNLWRKLVRSRSGRSEQQRQAEQERGVSRHPDTRTEPRLRFTGHGSIFFLSWRGTEGNRIGLPRRF
jgi:hypothetical protein